MLTVIYVDVLMFINTVVTYAVLTTCEKLFKRRTKLLRLISAAFIGSLFSLLMFFGTRSFVISLLLKTASSMLITLIAFSYGGRKEYFRTTLAVIGISTVYSGLFILLYQLFKPPNMAVINDVVYFEFNPLVLTALTAVIYIMITLFHKLFFERIKNTVVHLEATVNERRFSCLAKIDTGCDLTEPFSGAPVILVDRSVFCADEFTEKRVIPCTTVGGSSILYGVKAQLVSIGNTVIDREIYIAGAPVDNTAFQAIINSEIVR